MILSTGESDENLTGEGAIDKGNVTIGFCFREQFTDVTIGRCRQSYGRLTDRVLSYDPPTILPP